MKLIFITLFILSVIVGSAQHKTNFSSQNYVGLLEGQQGSKFQLETINGLRRENWFAGLGTGLDWYYLRSVPVFFSLSRDLVRKGNRAFFVSANSGVNFPWKDDHFITPQYQSEKQIPGFFAEAGAGYKIGLGKKNDAVLLRLGYSYKSSSEKVTPFYYYYTLLSPQEDITEHFNYRLHRLSLQIGWNF